MTQGGAEYLDGTTLIGDLATDRVCPSKNESGCSNSQQFVALTKSKGLYDYEAGILGMWSGNEPGYDNTEMLLPGLCADSLLLKDQECIFSFYLTGTSG